MVTFLYVFKDDPNHRSKATDYAQTQQAAEFKSTAVGEVYDQFSLLHPLHSKPGAHHPFVSYRFVLYYRPQNYENTEIVTT